MTVNQPEKLTGTSLDLAAEKRAHLKALFPTVFSESQNAQGEVVEAIDFEKLKAELGSFSELFEGRRERYGMDWPGKKDALRLIQTPSLYLNYLLTMGAFEDSVILDFFAGSATTAHAVLDLNKDGGNRKFILVQLPEPCAPDSEAYKAGYQTIADIGKERIRRVIHKLNAEQAGKLDLAQAGLQDRGFKVFKLDQSNFKQWHPLPPNTPPADIVQQLELHIDPIRSQATPEDLLYEILLKAGFTPTEKIERKVIAGQQVFAVPGKALLLCLEESVSKALIDAVAEAEPTQFICLDSAFHGDDSLKANAVQTFAARNMQREKHNQIIFRTV